MRWIWIFGLSSLSILNAQTVETTSSSGILAMRDLFVEQNFANNKLDGWRIQFYSTTDRRNMESTIRTLERKYPNVKFSWVYNSPYYQVRAGAFLSRKDLLRLQYALKRDYPGAFPVQDKIDIKELVETY